MFATFYMLFFTRTTLPTPFSRTNRSPILGIGKAQAHTQMKYQKIGPEYELAKAIIETRGKAGLTQDQLAKKMKTAQSVIARLESGNVNPSTKTLECFAKATGTRLKINFEQKGIN